MRHGSKRGRNFPVPLNRRPRRAHHSSPKTNRLRLLLQRVRADNPLSVTALYERRMIDAAADTRKFGGHSDASELQQMAEPFRVAYVFRDGLAYLQRRHGYQQKRRARRARLADHIRLQHVSVPRFQMGRWNFV